MSKSPLEPIEILQHMALDTHPGLFVLGCRERRVTFYAQQVRALNLVYALEQTKRLKRGEPLIVIGGGVAGLTAAAAASIRGFNVTLLEQNPELLHLQEGCTKRWIHPRIYDWPDPEAMREDTEELGVLTWKAGTAQDVISTLKQTWQEQFAARVTCHPAVKDLRLERHGDLWRVTLLPKALKVKSNVVILAVGFGVERDLGTFETQSYWRDDDLDQASLRGERDVLISGVGDGGLTDLFRACLQGFRHDTFVRDLGLVAAGSKNPLGERLLEIEDGLSTFAADPDRASDYLGEEYARLGDLTQPVDDALTRHPRSDLNVVLNGPTPDFVTTQASILNRFLASRLIALGIAEYWPDPIRAGGIVKKGGRWEVETVHGESRQFDRVVLRHGTNPALASVFPREKLWEKSANLAAKNQLDQTRRPILGWYGNDWFNSRPTKSPPPPASKVPAGKSTSVEGAPPSSTVPSLGLEAGREKPTAFIVPYPAKGEHLIGQEGKLEQVRQSLLSGQHTSIGQAAVFQGLGGLGKTQLAVEYAHRYRNEYHNGVYWLEADRDIAGQLPALAEEAGWVTRVADHAFKLEEARRRLRSLSDCLIIFDNLEDVSAIRDYLPKPPARPHLLATSRTGHRQFTPVPLDVLSLEESVALLCQVADKHPKEEKERQAVQDIATQLGGLPLALELAGAFLKHRQVSFHQYQSLLEARPRTALKNEHLDSFTQHEADLWATLELSESLFDGEPHLRRILQILTWSGTAAMGTYLLAHLLGAEEVDLFAALGLGVRLRLLSREEASPNEMGGARYRLHRLVQRVWQDQQPLDEDWGRLICQRLRIWGEAHRSDFAELPWFESELPHISAWQAHAHSRGWVEEAALIWLQAYPLYHRGEYRASLRLVKQAEQSPSLQKDPRLEARILQDQAELARLLGNLKDALSLASRALELQKQNLPGLDRDIVLSLNVLGMAYYNLNDNNRALEHLQNALDIQRQLVGDEHPETAMSYGNLGLPLAAVGRLGEAQEHMSRSLVSARLEYGDGHPLTATMYQNLGVVIGMSVESADRDKALTLTLRALEIRLKCLGSCHSDTALAYHSVGTCYGEGKDHKAAIGYLKESIRIRNLRQEYGHQDTLATLTNLTHSLRALKRDLEAFNILKEWITHLPAGHQARATLVNLANKKVPPSYSPLRDTQPPASKRTKSTSKSSR